jgi:hypothetical protein
MRLTTFAFGDLATGIWGIAAAAEGLAVATFASELRVDDDADESLLSAAGLELRFAASSGQAAFAPAEARIGGYAELCRVEGAVQWDGSEQELACLGMRSTIQLPAAAAASARAAAAWFGPGDGFALVALRPSGARGHSADAVACALFEDGEMLAVEEARFSTTYTGAGLPAHAGLELWLEPAPEPGGAGEPEGADEDDERHRSYARRAAGERAAEGSHMIAGGLRARGEPFRWRARGADGAGVYVLVPAP